MNISAANMIIVIIQSQYEGGVRRFLEEGGDMFYLPEPIDKIFVAPGGLTEDIQNKISSTLGEKVEFRGGLNFGDDVEVFQQRLEDIAQFLNKNKIPAGSVVFNRVVNTISMPTIRKGSNLAKSLEKLISAMPGHCLSYLIYENGFKRLEAERARMAPESNTGRPEREQVISIDDIDNLKIALGLLEKEGDFDRFLKQI